MICFNVCLKNKKTLSSIERFKAILNLECFFVFLRSIRLKLELFYEKFFVHWVFVFLVNVTYFVERNTNNQCGIFKTLWPHVCGIFAMLSIEAFLFGDLLVHVQGVSGSFNDSSVVGQRDDNVK